MPRPKIGRGAQFARACASWNALGQTPRCLCEPAQSKCTGTSHKSHFVWEFTGKKAASQSAGADFLETAQPKRTWTSQNRKNAGDQMEHPDQAPALTLSVRTPRGHPDWGKTTPTVVQQGMSRPFSCLHGGSNTRRRSGTWNIPEGSRSNCPLRRRPVLTWQAQRFLCLSKGFALWHRLTIFHQNLIGTGHRLPSNH